MCIRDSYRRTSEDNFQLTYSDILNILRTTAYHKGESEDGLKHFSDLISPPWALLMIIKTLNTYSLIRSLNTS